MAHHKTKIKGVIILWISELPAVNPPPLILFNTLECYWNAPVEDREDGLV